MVAVNISRDAHAWHPQPFSGDWRVLMRNYPDSRDAPGEMMLRPFEAVWWYQGI